MDDLIEEFIQETTESIGELDNEIIQLEQNPEDIELMNSIFRLMHTIKGTCGFLGLERLQQVAHYGENILDKMRNLEITVDATAVSLILESIDRIKELLAVLEETGAEPEGEDSELIAKLEAFAEGGDVPAAAETPAAEAPAEEEASAEDQMAAVDEEIQEAAAHAEEVAEAGETDSEYFNEEDFVPIPAGMTGEVNDGAETEEPAAEAPAPAETPKAEPAPVAAQKVAVDEGLKAKPQEEAKKAPTASIRVNIDVLENLMTLVSELVLTRNQLLQISRTGANGNSSSDESDYSTPLQRLSHITSDLQEGVMKTRMQPIGNAWNKLPRIIRDLSMELSKKIDFKMVGEETEIDRQLLELVRDPLTHMVRNSADHGVETPDIRVAAGKPETGSIVLSAFHEGGFIIVQIKDDGKGIDPEIIKNKAIEKGLVSEEDARELDNRQILQFIFAPGFSTAEQVTSVSGRGVGMDVVRTNIEQMGGSVELDSDVGKGTTFQMKIPLTLAILPVLLMEVQGHKFGIPQINVLELVKADSKADHRIEKINDTPVLRIRGQLLPLIDLKHTFGIENEAPIIDIESLAEEAEAKTEEINENSEAEEISEEVAEAPKPAVEEPQAPKSAFENQFIVICEIGTTSFGLIVDKIFDTEEIVVKPVSSALNAITLYSGSTILGDGSVVMILDPNGLAKSINANVSKQNAGDKEEVLSTEDMPVSFLVFASGDAGPKAVPLELVARLEDLDPKDIENAGELKVIQYRDELMRLASLHENGSYTLKDMPAEQGSMNVLVFSDQGRTLGLVVDQIIDIVEQKMDLTIDNKDERFIGSMVIDGKTTDLLDVGKLFGDSFREWGSDKKAKGNKEEAEKPQVLIVEDSAFFRKLMVPILISRGYGVRTAVNGVEAMEILEEDNKFSVIITDIEMPGMNGFELANKCKTTDSLKHIPVVALTSVTSEEAVRKSEEAGVDHFVMKAEHEKVVDIVSEITQKTAITEEM